ncbi:cyclic peptide export ABC transporter [Dokdonia sp.]|uniref:cyclic peptide export ABC transporter n=1 Tax=Dokdonia sp. TaxID=2024995 RepID=UPI003267594C
MNNNNLRMRVVHINLLTVLMLMSSFVGNAQKIANKEFLQSFEEIVRSSMREGDIPGLSVVLIDGERELIKTFGYADIDNKELIQPNTLFELGSCSKAFTALAITRLVNEKKLEYDDFVSDYIPWFKMSYEGRQVKITIRQLLHHTSGIPWQTISKIPESNEPDALEVTIKILNSQKLKHFPGQKYEYATINYDILALIIQNIMGQSFESYIQRNVFDELGLKYTTIGEPVDASLMTLGYKIGFFSPRRYEAPVYKGNNAAGYVISNALDIKSWLKLQLGLTNSKISDLIKQTHERDHTVALHGMSSYAKGWDVSLDGTGEINHSGMNPNFSSYITFRPESGLGVAVLANSNSNYTVKIGNEIMKLLADEKIEKGYDPGDQNDKAFSIVSIALFLFSLIVTLFLISIFIDIFKKKRKYESYTITKFGNLLKSLLLVAPFLFGLYILPKAMADFTWESIIVWTPGSFYILLITLLITISITYLTYFVGLLFPEPKAYKKIAPKILLFSFLSGIANIVIIIMVTSALDTKEGLGYILYYYLLVMGIYILGRRYVQVNLIKFTKGVIYDLRVRIVEKILSTSYQKFEKIDRGRVYTSLNDDVNRIGQASSTLVTLITSCITAIGAFIYLASIAMWATLLTVFIILAITTLYYLISARTNRYFEEARDSRDVFMRLLNGLIDGFKELSLHGNKKLEYKTEVATSANEYRDKTSVAEIRFTNAFLVGESLLVVLLGFVAFGMNRFFPNIEFYAIMGFVIILLYLIGPINGILNAIPELMQLKVAWKRINIFIRDIPSNLYLENTPSKTIIPIKSISAEGVKFKYKKADKENVFGIGPINLKVCAGEILFIVGGNGSGKTTLAKLLTGLYEADEGDMKINDCIVQPSELGEYFSTVFSPPYIFEKLYNVNTFEREEEIANYLNLLKLENKVYLEGKNYSTISLSGGQRKRLALFQCYLEDSPIYLFDEWAADQDPGYRNFFYRTLLPEMKKKGKIVIAITHDDHYFDVADVVLKMNQGKLETYANKDVWESLKS